MGLRLYNTLTRQKEAFTPLDPARVRMYVCGPTVYDRAHIGNARPVIVFDVLFRLLKHLAKQGVWDGGKGQTEVTYVRNITDVDDKINARAAERGVPIRELTEETYKWFKEDVAALGCLEPTFEPRATEYVPQMIEMIKTLVAMKHAYVAEGHVLYDVSSKPDYGKLSNRSVDEMLAGARVEVAPYKKNPMDFVLWKPSTPELPGWESPWGRGRPGWHIECSAMSETLLGQTFDIHGGGIDLAFPHHENEIAQSEGAHHGEPLAKVWMHNGFLQVEGEKMAKSVGNVVPIHQALADVLVDWAGDLIRFNMLKTHYRQPIDWTVRGLEETESVLRNWANVLEPHQTSFNSDDLPPKEFLSALLDDLNTPMAIAKMHELAEKARRGDLKAAQELHQAGKFIGIFSHALMSSKNLASVGEAAVKRMPAEFQREVNSKLEARAAARKARNFKEADRIRDELANMGVELEDLPDGTTKARIRAA